MYEVNNSDWYDVGAATQLAAKQYTNYAELDTLMYDVEFLILIMTGKDEPIVKEYLENKYGAPKK